MKVLNLNYQIGKYSVEINNCIDYNIAEITSFFEQDFFEIYNSFWCLYSNYYEFDNEKVRQEILKILGLELCDEVISNKEELVKRIKEKIDLGMPVILNVPNSILFYSVMYKNENVKGFNHSIIVNGYDEEKDIFYIRENTINIEVLSQLTPSQPFSVYVLTRKMIEDIYHNIQLLYSNCEMFSKLFQYIKQNEEVNLNDIKQQLISESLQCLKNREDFLVIELRKTLTRGYYHSYYREEEFRRVLLHSYKPLFNEIRTQLNFIDLEKYDYMIETYIRYKENIINMLAKNSFRLSKVNEGKVAVIIEKLMEFQSTIYDFLNKNIDIESTKMSTYTPISREVKITCDSELTIGTKTFYAKNVWSDSKINNNFHYWISANTLQKHWIQIDFLDEIEIQKIVIIHKANIKYITQNYTIMHSNDGKHWKTLKSIKNNAEVKNEFSFKEKVILRYFKIIISKANTGIDYSARVQKIEFYK